MDIFWKDVKHGARLLIKSPGISAVSILALTLGIGLTTTMFSIVYGALFRGLPFEHSEQIMHVELQNLPRGWESVEIGIHDYHEYRDQQRSFQSLAAFYDGSVSISGTERAERYDGAFMSANGFDVLGVKPIMGRTFRPDEDSPSAEPVIVIGYAVWQNRFDSDPRVVGTTIRANGRPATIIGVMPERFEFPANEQVWLPLKLDPLTIKRGEGMTLEVFGRLNDDRSIDEATADLTGIAKRLELEFPATNKDLRPSIKPYTDEFIGEEPRALLYTMLGAVLFVLLIGCTNVANLLLGRAILRSKEVGIRTALGAGRWRLITQFLTEALVLSVVGALLGLVLAWVGVRLFNNSLVVAQPPFWIDIRLDRVAVLFVLALTLITSLFSGTIPALQASRADVTDVLKDESRGSSSFRLGKISRALVVFEIALSCGLLVAAGLTIKSVVKLRNVDLGFDQTNLFTARVALPEISYADSTAPQFFERLQSRLATVQGIESFTFASSLPGLGEGAWSFAVEGKAYERDQDHPEAPRAAVSTSYFNTLGVKVLEGRNFNDMDRAGTLPVAIVNRSFARKYFEGGSAIGRRIRLGTSQTTRPWMTIVGVVPDLRVSDLEDMDVSEAMFVPFLQNPQRFMSMIGRTRAEPLGVTGAVRDAVTSVDADVPLYFVNTLGGAIAEETWFFRVFGTLFIIFGVAALLLAAIGLYAVMAFSVSQRTREVGIRMAIGAEARDVLRMILKQGFAQVALGMLFGLALAAGVSQLLSIILFDVEPRDPIVFGAIVLLLTLTSVLACLLPALRATKVDPLEALRYE